MVQYISIQVFSKQVSQRLHNFKIHLYIRYITYRWGLYQKCSFYHQLVNDEPFFELLSYIFKNYENSVHHYQKMVYFSIIVISP